MRRAERTFPLPYADVGRAVLDTIYDLLYIIYQNREVGGPTKAMMERLRIRASKLHNEPWARRGKNPHIVQAITSRGATSRIVRVCLEAVEHAQTRSSDTENEKRKKGIFLPSPLAILVDVLTVPSYPESRAYGFALARAILSSHFKIHLGSGDPPPGWSKFSLSEARDVIDSFRIYAKHRDNIHNPKTKRTRVFLAHCLAQNGIFVLRFGTRGRQKDLHAKISYRACLDFLKKKAFLKEGAQLPFTYEFRLLPGLIDIPDSQEILNTLVGVPLPFAGGETVFFGGLRRSQTDAAVISVSGPPGTGKTTFALGLAATLAPFGTRCLYCTFEEDSETVKRRALGVSPAYFRRTTLLPKADWLTPIELNSSVVGGVEKFTHDYVSVLRSELAKVQLPPRPPGATLPAIAPTLLVVDSLTTLLDSGNTDGVDLFYRFVRELRSLNCIVLLLSSEEIPRESHLDFLVDVVVALRHVGTGDPAAKPIRLFVLTKTRLQMSRPGAHLLHLSGEGALRISPQLPSQLDSHKIHRTLLPDRTATIDSLRPDLIRTTNRRKKLGDRKRNLVDLYPGSRILVHGLGSSAKAVLALRLLTGGIRDLTSGDFVAPSFHKHPRILVVSFLYPVEWYDERLRKLKRLHAREGQRAPFPEMTVIAHTPSFIGPEDFLGEVIASLEQGTLDGLPYTGVLLDGLHNTFLQFPLLQGSHMVWPALYSILSRYNLTVATTFTTFEITDFIGRGQSREDEELTLEGQRPFLHALIQATDFQLRVDKRQGSSGDDRTFRICVETALNQPIPADGLIWNADSFTFEDWDPATPPPQILAEIP